VKLKSFWWVGVSRMRVAYLVAEQMNWVILHVWFIENVARYECSLLQLIV
jgi:hypothetical protein